MNTKEKLQFFFDHGISMSYIAQQLNLNPSTLTKWLKGQKGITHKNEDKINKFLKQFIEELNSII